MPCSVLTRVSVLAWNRGWVATAALISPLQTTELIVMWYVCCSSNSTQNVSCFGIVKPTWVHKAWGDFQGPCPCLQASGYSSLEDSFDHDASGQNSILLDHGFPRMSRESEKGTRERSDGDIITGSYGVVWLFYQQNNDFHLSIIHYIAYIFIANATECNNVYLCLPRSDRIQLNPSKRLNRWKWKW